MVIKLLIRVKNLKKNPGMVSILKRRCSVMSLITRLVYDTRVHDISLETNRKHDFIVTCNGIKKKFHDKVVRLEDQTKDKCYQHRDDQNKTE